MRLYRIETAPLHPLVVVECDSLKLACELAPILARHCDWPVRVYDARANRIVREFSRAGVDDRPKPEAVDPEVSKAAAMEFAEKQSARVGGHYYVIQRENGTCYASRFVTLLKGNETVAARFFDGEFMG